MKSASTLQKQKKDYWLFRKLKNTQQCFIRTTGCTEKVRNVKPLVFIFKYS